MSLPMPMSHIYRHLFYKYQPSQLHGQWWNTIQIIRSSATSDEEGEGQSFPTSTERRPKSCLRPFSRSPHFYDLYGYNGKNCKRPRNGLSVKVKIHSAPMQIISTISLILICLKLWTRAGVSSVTRFCQTFYWQFHGQVGHTTLSSVESWLTIQWTLKVAP